jgi:hypothetical protein
MSLHGGFHMSLPAHQKLVFVAVQRTEVAA